MLLFQSVVINRVKKTYNTNPCSSRKKWHQVPTRRLWDPYHGL